MPPVPSVFGVRYVPKSKPKPRRDARPFTEEIPDRPKPSLVVRLGIAILGLAVVITSLMPLLSLFQR